MVKGEGKIRSVEAIRVCVADSLDRKVEYPATNQVFLCVALDILERGYVEARRSIRAQLRGEAEEW